MSSKKEIPHSRLCHATIDHSTVLDISRFFVRRPWIRRSRIEARLMSLHRPNDRHLGLLVGRIRLGGGSSSVRRLNIENMLKLAFRYSPALGDDAIQQLVQVPGTLELQPTLEDLFELFCENFLPVCLLPSHCRLLAYRLIYTGYSPSQTW